MSAPAIAFPRFTQESETSDCTSVSAQPNSHVKYLLTLVKGENRPPEDELVYIGQRHERDEPVPVAWECMGIFESKGAAQAVQDWHMRQPGAHRRDKWQITPFVENAVMPRERFHLPDDTDTPPASNYVVLQVDKLEDVLRCLQSMGKPRNEADE